MKLTLAIPLAAALMTSACVPLVSIHPFVPEGDATVDAALAGVWADDDDTVVIRQKGSAYEVTFLEKGKTATRFEGRLLKAEAALLLDLVPATDDAFAQPLHWVARIWIEGNTLRWAPFDSDWLVEQATAALATTKEGDRTLITAPSAAVRDWLLKVGGNDKAYGKPDVLTRVQ